MNRICNACNIKIDENNYLKDRTVCKSCYNKNRRKNKNNNTLIQNQQPKVDNTIHKKPIITRKWHSESVDPAKALDLSLAKQTNRQTKNFVHTEVRTLDPRVFSTMLLPTEL